MLLRRHRRTTKENVQPSEMAVETVLKEVVKAVETVLKEVEKVEKVPKVTKSTKKEGDTSGRGRSKTKA